MDNSSLVGLFKNISSVIIGKQEAILLTIATLLCRGHLLIEDAPGLGKTMLARALASSLDMDFKRIQCTPDLLPSDITGVSVYNQKTLEFDFMRGPVFTNILLVDEINRATPRTQSSLLEAMAENQVSVDGTTWPLADVFMTIATQNPIEYHGTYPLPEAQLDRFFMRINMGYPELAEEISIMQMQKDRHPIHALQAVLDLDTLARLQGQVTRVHIEPDVLEYIARIVQTTRDHKDLAMGASPRGSLAMMMAARAMALLSGKDYVQPNTVKQVAVPVLAHRLIAHPVKRSAGVNEESVLMSILNHVRVPVAAA
ncbi:MAG: MoxR family ATPase [Pseudomonadota bacterium]